MERLDLEFKAAPGTDGEIVGYASLFGGPADAVNDIVQAGAFRDSLSQALPLMLREHKGQPVGQWVNVVEDDIGLKVRGRVTDAATLADLRAARLDGLSIGFVATKAHRDNAGRRVLGTVDLQEISVVKRPASSRARVLSVKSADAAQGAMMSETSTAAVDDAADNYAADLAAVETKAVAAVGAAVTAALAPITTRLDQVERVLRRPGAGAAETKADAGTVERKSFENYLRRGREGMDLVEVKTMRVADDESGGYLAPAEFIAEIDKNVVLFSPVRSLATVRNTSRGLVQIPRRIGTPLATWVEELEDRDGTVTEVKYGQSQYSVKELTAYVDVSLSMLEDSAIDIFAEIASDLGECFGYSEGEAFVNGNGVKRPMGFMSDTSVPEVSSGHASQVTADSLIDAYHALPAPYRNSAVWCMNYATLGSVRKLKTGDGQYLLSMSGLSGAPVTTLLGKLVVELPDMPNVGAGNSPIVLGDFSQGYRVLDRVGLSILRDDFTQSTKGKVMFHARRRVAGGIRKSEALRKLVVRA